NNNQYHVSTLSQTFIGSSGVYFAVPSAVVNIGLGQHGSMLERHGNAINDEEGRVWYRLTSRESNVQPETNSYGLVEYDQYLIGHEFGGTLFTSVDKKTSGGLMFNLADSSTSVNGEAGNIDAKIMSFGGYATWLDDSDNYLDLSIKYHVMDVSTNNLVNGDSQNDLLDMTTIALEGGMGMDLPMDFEAKVGLRALYGKFETAGFSDSGGFVVGQSVTESLRASIIARVEKPITYGGKAFAFNSITPHLQLVYTEEIDGVTEQFVSTESSSTNMQSSMDGSVTSLELGVSAATLDDFQLYAQVRTALGDVMKKEFELSVGVRSEF
ncbi:MAG: autotransporter outer membrane beta-barrel domain-containing protein, partial [Gammaproteobacteria bacterium]|nr:autotransporter outer membrane beta-barrel domain-containing protein [Gammaproteobacteria bacterium]